MFVVTSVKKVLGQGPVLGACSIFGNGLVLFLCFWMITLFQCIREISQVFTAVFSWCNFSLLYQHVFAKGKIWSTRRSIKPVFMCWDCFSTLETLSQPERRRGLTFYREIARAAQSCVLSWVFAKPKPRFRAIRKRFWGLQGGSFRECFRFWSSSLRLATEHRPTTYSSCMLLSHCLTPNIQCTKINACPRAFCGQYFTSKLSNTVLVGVKLCALAFDV